VTVAIDASLEISDKVDVVVLEDDDKVTFGFGLLRLLLLQLLLLCPSLSLEYAEDDGHSPCCCGGPMLKAKGTGEDDMEFMQLWVPLYDGGITAGGKVGSNGSGNSAVGSGAVGIAGTPFPIPEGKLFGSCVGR